MERIKWFLKQLLPLSYVSEYLVHHPESDSYHREVCVWKMWFGHCYDVQTWRVVAE